MLGLRYTTMVLFLLILPSMARSQETSLIDRIQKVQTSLVEIKTVYSRALQTQRGQKGIASYERHGSGIIIDSSGIIVTNTHLVHHAPRILVKLSDGKIFEAQLLHENESDFSFIKVDAGYPLKAIVWADSSLAYLGEPIIALGGISDFNHQSILGGEITSLIESISSGEIQLLELNINLYEGDSGGPILDEKGRLLGLIMAKRMSKDRKSYAIASNNIRRAYLSQRLLVSGL